MNDFDQRLRLLGYDTPIPATETRPTLTPEDRAFILRRVRAEIACNPPAGPLLTEPGDAPAEACRRGHRDWAMQGGSWQCRACDRDRKRLRRARP